MLTCMHDWPKQSIARRCHTVLQKKFNQMQLFLTHSETLSEHSLKVLLGTKAQVYFFMERPEDSFC